VPGAAGATVGSPVWCRPSIPTRTSVRPSSIQRLRLKGAARAIKVQLDPTDHPVRLASTARTAATATPAIPAKTDNPTNPLDQNPSHASFAQRVQPDLQEQWETRALPDQKDLHRKERLMANREELEWPAQEDQLGDQDAKVPKDRLEHPARSTTVPVQPARPARQVQRARRAKRVRQERTRRRQTVHQALKATLEGPAAEATQAQQDQRESVDHRVQTALATIAPNPDCPPVIEHSTRCATSRPTRIFLAIS